MDTSKVGIATAKAMDEIERLVSSGAIREEAEVAAVVICVALDAKTPDDAPHREELRNTETQVFSFSEPDPLYVQIGVLHIALENYGPTGWPDD